MADESRSRTRKRSNNNKRKLIYFYLNGHLHKVLQVNRPADLMYAWDCTDEKRVAFVLSDVRRRLTRAYKTLEVAAMVNRNRVSLERAILRGDVKAPQKYGNWAGKGMYYWSEEDILGLHDYLLTVHKGPRRKDGLITPAPMPTRAELKAMMKHDTVMYVKNSDNEFVPVWKEAEW